MTQEEILAEALSKVPGGLDRGSLLSLMGQTGFIRGHVGYEGNGFRGGVAGMLSQGPEGRYSPSIGPVDIGYRNQQTDVGAQLYPSGYYNVEAQHTLPLFGGQLNLSGSVDKNKDYTVGAEYKKSFW